MTTWPRIPPAPGTPPCAPPRHDPDTGWTVTRYADVRAVLTDPDCQVPVAPAGDPGTLAGLRATVSRFSAAATHPRRRALVTAALTDLDPADLRAEASRRTREVLDRAAGRLDVMADLARRVPVGVLADRLGFAGGPAGDGVVAAVGAVAAAYHPGADATVTGRADDAVARLSALAPPGPDEVVANRIGLLVQACDATAGLVGNAARWVLTAPPSRSTGVLLAEVLRLDPPVRTTRRVAAADAVLDGRPVTAGSPVLLRLDAANRDPAVFDDPDRFDPDRAAAPPLTFGVGERGCPGERHALALAAGVVDVLRRRCRPAPAPVRHEPAPNLHVPVSLEVLPR